MGDCSIFSIKAGFLVSRVEYVKRAPVEEDLRIVLTHVGAVSSCPCCFRMKC